MKNETFMKEKPVLPLIISMALPMVISMCVNSLYNIVDSYFVAKISENAMTALSLVYPVQNFINAVAIGFGVGINAVIAFHLGAGDKHKADDAATQGLLLSLIHGVVLTISCIFIMKPFLSAFTKDENVISLGVQYCNIVFLFTIINSLNLFFEKLFQAVGNMFVPMILQGVGAIVNIVLDPILIFGLLGLPALGVTGAAVATVAGQMTACSLAVLYFFRTNPGIHITLPDMRPDRSIAKRIYAVGVPSGLMTAMPSLLVGILNALLVELHALAVAAFGLYFKLQTFVYMPANGLIQGMRPLISYNYGAGRQDRMRHIIRWSLILTAVIMAAGTLLAWLLPTQIMGLFDADRALIAVGVPMLRITSLGFLVSTLGTVLAGCFEALGKGLRSLAVSCIRQLIIIPPLALVFSRFWGLNGVWATFPVAETLAALVAVLLYFRLMKQLCQREEESNSPETENT